MHLDVPVVDLLDAGTSLRLTTVPDTCPRCHRNIHAKFCFGAIHQGRDIAQAIFRCTNQRCQELFIATYKNLKRHSTGGQEFQLANVAPMSPQQSSFPDIIIGVSSSFIEIYNQALAAEAAGLTQLVGIGLRKALEFLIKDYAASENPNDKVAIEQSLLGNCIEKYINDPNVKQCAKRAAWLGNDETHYLRRWDDKDVNDLKLLVKLTVNWIENVLLTKKYVEEMQTKGT